MIRVSIVMPEGTLALVDEQARADHRSRSSWILRTVEAALGVSALTGEDVAEVAQEGSAAGTERRPSKAEDPGSNPGIGSQASSPVSARKARKQVCEHRIGVDAFCKECDS